ncbi:MAG: GNAT family N-acetyltransferase [Jatrophihabitans sp.]
MVEVFAEAPADPLGDEYLDRLLARNSFWALAALVGSTVVGGLTAHTLPMTRSDSSEVFIYDLAVATDHQRQGVGSALVLRLRQAAAAEGVHEVFVAADDEDAHALDFYRTQGAIGDAVTMFTFAGLSPTGR